MHLLKSKGLSCLKHLQGLLSSSIVGGKYSGLREAKLKTKEKFEPSLPIPLTKVRVQFSMDMGALAPVVFSSTYISVVSWLGLHFGSNNYLMISTHEIPKSGPG